MTLYVDIYYKVIMCTIKLFFKVVVVHTYTYSFALHQVTQPGFMGMYVLALVSRDHMMTVTSSTYYMYKKNVSLKNTVMCFVLFE